jgi:SAM-dependent methyltransferase
MGQSPPDWQLPPGVSRHLWDYQHNPQLAEGYDASLADTPLAKADVAFARECFAQPGRLIDLGCGTGRLAIDFASRGFAVVGVDLSAEMLRVAAEKAARTGAQLDLVQANLVELDALADASFDYAACLFSTLGMITGEVERQRAVAHAFRLLRSGGKFLLHVHNRWFHFWDRNGQRWLLGDVYRELRGLPAGDRRMPAHRGLAGLSLHHFTRREAVRLLKDVGFRVEDLRPLSLRSDGRLPWPWWFGWLRAYGYLILSRKPNR